MVDALGLLLNTEELQARYGRYDSDGDGRVEAEELARMPDSTLSEMLQDSIKDESFSLRNDHPTLISVIPPQRWGRLFMEGETNEILPVPQHYWEDMNFAQVSEVVLHLSQVGEGEWADRFLLQSGLKIQDWAIVLRSVTRKGGEDYSESRIDWPYQELSGGTEKLHADRDKNGILEPKEWKHLGEDPIEKVVFLVVAGGCGIERKRITTHILLSTLSPVQRAHIFLRIFDRIPSFYSRNREDLERDPAVQPIARFLNEHTRLGVSGVALSWLQLMRNNGSLFASLSERAMEDGVSKLLSEDSRWGLLQELQRLGAIAALEKLFDAEGSSLPTPVFPPFVIPGISGVSEENFRQEVIQSEVPVIVVFGFSACSACKAASPVISEMAKGMRGAVKIVSVDVNSDEALSLVSRYEIGRAPTFVIFRHGVMRGRKVGFRDTDEDKKDLQEFVLNSYVGR